MMRLRNINRFNARTESMNSCMIYTQYETWFSEIQNYCLEKINITTKERSFLKKSIDKGLFELGGNSSIINDNAITEFSYEANQDNIKVIDDKQEPINDYITSLLVLFITLISFMILIYFDIQVTKFCDWLIKFGKWLKDLLPYHYFIRKICHVYKTTISYSYYLASSVEYVSKTKMIKNSRSKRIKYDNMFKYFRLRSTTFKLEENNATTVFTDYVNSYNDSSDDENTSKFSSSRNSIQCINEIQGRLIFQSHLQNIRREKRLLRRKFIHPYHRYFNIHTTSI